MKGFIFTVSLFIILVVLIISNYFFVNEVHDHMHSKVNELDTAPSDKNSKLIIELKDFWESNKAMLSISVSFREIDDLSNALDAVYAANSTQNAVQLSINIELLQNAIDAIMRLERISIENIF